MGLRTCHSGRAYTGQLSHRPSYTATGVDQECKADKRIEDLVWGELEMGCAWACTNTQRRLHGLDIAAMPQQNTVLAYSMSAGDLLG